MQAALFALLPLVLLANAQEPSCGNTRTEFEGVGAADLVFSSLRPQAGSVCQLSDTCCSLEAETAFKQRMVHNYETEVTTQLSQGLRTCRNHSIFGDMSTYISENKVQLVGDITTIYTIYSRRYLNLFDRFFNYLSESVRTGNLTELPTEMNQIFFELFLASFLSNPNAPSTLPNTEEFRTCFYNIFLEQNGHTVQEHLRGFERSWNTTMRYFRALKAMERVVDGVLSQPGLSEECQVSLMRMTDCARCAGFSDSAQSCNGLCLNTMRGCLLDLGDLVAPMQEFSEALVMLKNRVLTFSPFVQITLLQSHIFSFISSNNGLFFTIITEATNRCGLEVPRRGKRQAGSGGLTRVTRSGITVPVDTMNESAYCLLTNMELFSHMPDTLCGGEGVNAGNDNCWNGHQLGSYSRNVVNYSRTLQVNNPEVLVCPRQHSRFAAEIQLLRYMTREMTSLTGSCSDDDEDCMVVPPTSLYYDLDAIVFDEPITAATTTDDVSSEGSGSGSEVDACQPVPPPTTTTVPVTAAPMTATLSATVAATTAAPATSSPTTAVSATSPTATEAVSTTSVQSSTEATHSRPTVIPDVTGIVVEVTGSHTVPVPGGEQTGGIPVNTNDVGIGVPTDDIGVGVPGEQGQGTGTSVNRSRGLIPSSLTVCAGLALTALVLSLSTPSHSH